MAVSSLNLASCLLFHHDGPFSDSFESITLGHSVILDILPAVRPVRGHLQDIVSDLSSDSGGVLR